jgi:predicted O-methyltransferase YrrM
VGTGIGYGTLHLARGARQGLVVTIDVDAGRQAIAREYLDRAGLAGRVEMVTAAALEAIPRLAPPFHLVFLDAKKSEYRRCLDLALPLVVLGGRIVVDNLLWSGRVADPSLRPDDGDSDADAIERFNPYFLSHPQLAAVLLPLGDGVGLAVKTRPTIMEQGGPF